MPLCVLVPRVGIEVLLHLRHPAVRLGAETQLDLDKSFEGGVEIRHAQVDQLRQLRAELLVQLLVRRPGHIHLLLGAGQLGDILVRLLHQLLDFGAEGVVIEEFVTAFLDACDGSKGK